MFKTYYALTKPGIVYGNVLNALAGFLLAAAILRHFDVGLLLVTMCGLALVIASGCVFNNYMDRAIDKKMARTKSRALVQGTVSGRASLVYACCLGAIGFVTLATTTNLLTVLIAVIGFIDYVFLYGYGKRHSIHGTLIGSISGATPPLIGYCAVTNQLDAPGIILFLMLVLWQMPHFYAIATYRLKDYKNADIPVWPAVKGVHSTKIQILSYIVAFMVASCLLTIYGYTGYIYLAVMLAINLWWLRLAISGFKAKDDDRWARKIFGFSLIVTMVVAVMVPLGILLP